MVAETQAVTTGVDASGNLNANPALNVAGFSNVNMVPPAPGTFAPAPAGPAGGDTALINQLMQWLTTTGGGMGVPGMGGMGGGSPMLPGIDPLSLGMDGMGGGDPLGMGGMFGPMGGGIGLNPYQAAGLRLRRGNEMNALRQRMANQHRAIGPAGGTDFSRHVQNIDDEMMALQEQKVQDNIKNALAYNQQLQQFGQQNLANNMKLFEALKEAGSNMMRYGGANQSPGTFSPDSGSDQQGA